MQDRFKFRCYNNKDNTIYDVYSFDNNFIRANPYNACINSIRTFKTSDCILMQCTGLKDKNSKLIYEGDIIQFYIDDDDPYARSFVTMKIVWEDYELDFKAIGLNKNVECYKDDYQYLSCINIQQDELEVIGNIYENPELLEGHND